MENSNLLILVVLFVMTAVSESGVLVPRDLASAKNEIPFGRDKKLGLFPASKNPEQDGEDDFGVYEYESGGIDPHGPPNYDHGKPEGGDKKKPGKEPEIFFPDPDEERIQKPDENSEDKKGEVDEDRNDDKNEEDDEDRNDDKENDLDKKPGEEGFYEPFDGEEDSDKSDDKDSKIPEGIKPDDEDEDKKEPGEDYDGNDEKPEEENDTKVPEDDDDDENNDKKGTEGEDDDKKVAEDNEEKPDEEEDKEEHLPGSDDEKSEDEENNDGGEEGFLSGGSIFDNPIFNLEQVQKYFRQLEKALGLVFKQTLDEALLLNGTYANTTEEEVEINGKKYIVQKSIIKGADNHSAIYVEALSTKPKGSDTTEPKYDEAKNETDV